MAGEKFDDLDDTNQKIWQIKLPRDEEDSSRPSLGEFFKEHCEDLGWTILSCLFWSSCFVGSCWVLFYVVKSYDQ